MFASPAKGDHPPLATPALLSVEFLVGLVLVGLAGPIGCKDQDKLRQDEAIKAAVAADRKLAEQEQDLLARRGALQRRRSSLREQRSALMSRKMALPAGQSQDKEALEAEESQLARLEATLVKQELKLNQRLDDLLERKSGLVASLGKDDDQAKHVLLVHRELSVAGRERDFSRREADLAVREKTLAAREQALATRQANLCGGESIAIDHVPSGAPSDTKYRRGDVEPLFRAARKAMRQKGILTADLPAGVDRLYTEIRHAVSRGEYTRAKYAVDQLLTAVRSVRIDREFIGAKIQRLSATIERSPRTGRNKKARDLFEQATTDYGDGRFSAANGKLNRIYALMR